MTFCSELPSRVSARELVPWLRASREDDDVEIAGRRTRFSDLLATGRDRVRLLADPMDLVFVPEG